MCLVVNNIDNILYLCNIIATTAILSEQMHGSENQSP